MKRLTCGHGNPLAESCDDCAKQMSTYDRYVMTRLRYYHSIVNGVYTGRTGPCFGCQGKGKADDSDRTRCHFYFRDHFRVYMGA